MTQRVSPCDGGCWFCYTVDDNLVFDTEFDTYVHVACIRAVLAREPSHPEARHMRYLIPTNTTPKQKGD